MQEGGHTDKVLYKAVQLGKNRLVSHAVSPHNKVFFA